MSGAFALALLALAAGTLQGQDAPDPADAARARKARINELRKELSAAAEATRIGAIKELGEIRDSDARSLLNEKMTTDSDAVRQAAAKAIIRHRRPICAQALGNAIQANYANEKLVKFFVETLAELDMCASIPILLATLQSRPALGDDILKAILAIGCPEAAGPLVNYLKRAETEEKKPDFFEDSGYGGGFGGVWGGGAGGGGRTENRTKDKVVAALAAKIRKALTQLTGLELTSHREWSVAVSSGTASPRVTSLYQCEETGKPYEIRAGKSPKCPHSTKSGHEDTFLKHRRE